MKHSTIYRNVFYTCSGLFVSVCLMSGAGWSGELKSSPEKNETSMIIKPDKAEKNQPYNWGIKNFGNYIDYSNSYDDENDGHGNHDGDDGSSGGGHGNHGSMGSGRSHDGC